VGIRHGSEDDSTTGLRATKAHDAPAASRSDEGSSYDALSDGSYGSECVRGSSDITDDGSSSEGAGR
jgi:hypothetical protein